MTFAVISKCTITFPTETPKDGYYFELEDDNK